MTQEQELKMQIIKEVCALREYTLDEIWNFLITPTEEIPTIKTEGGECISFQQSKPLADGVYICYKDGQKELFNGRNSKENVSHIGIKLGDIKFGVQLYDKGEYQLLRDGVKCPEKADHYTRNRINCFEDFDYVAATKRIKNLGTDIPLDESEYLPTMGLWGVMMLFASKIQNALIHVGGEPLTDEDWYWSATEYNANSAWYVGFTDGGVNGSVKYFSHRVRPVVAF